MIGVISDGSIYPKIEQSAKIDAFCNSCLFRDGDPSAELEIPEIIELSINRNIIFLNYYTLRVTNR